ncbi:glycosyltransferase family 4 protein [Sunxiuqinia indica]|uniref:glycosyltransferase family 4 protein n=1 Tax=Sunxiuqinia indica TaxID=2692584 RepID=UPI00135CD478|nr:glycosyltransferase family 1 protein [Sunxiuqinia indica]
MIYINGKFLTQQITGVQKFALQITKHLIQIDDDIRILVPLNCAISNTEKVILSHIVRIGSGTPLRWEQITIPTFLKSKGNPILLNFSGLGPVFYKNKITTIHDLSFWEHPEWFSKKYYLFYRILIPFTAKNSRFILTVSNYSKEIITKKLKIDPSIIEVIYNAVEPCRCDLVKNKRYKHILAVGSLDPRKNLKRLINAFILWNNKDYRLIVVGGKQNSFSKLDLPTNNNVVFTGYVADETLHKYYSESEIFVYPSLYEGFGIPPLEAMAHGLPVIASNVTSLPEACGKAAEYIDPNSVKSIIHALDKVSSNTKLRDEMIRKGYENIQRFSWKKSAQKINDFICKL